MFLILANSNCWTLFQQELYKKTEELEEKKADRRVVEREIVSGFILYFRGVGQVSTDEFTSSY